jgi:hypothetical protein
MIWIWFKNKIWILFSTLFDIFFIKNILCLFHKHLCTKFLFSFFINITWFVPFIFENNYQIFNQFLLKFKFIVFSSDQFETINWKKYLHLFLRMLDFLNKINQKLWRNKAQRTFWKDHHIFSNSTSFNKNMLKFNQINVNISELWFFNWKITYLC